MKLELEHAEQETCIFPPVSADEARRILRELDWGEHIVGAEMNPSAGSHDIYLFSLDEAARFVRYGTAGMGLSTGSKATVSWLEVDRFVEWVGTSVQDADLAKALAEGVASKESYFEKAQCLGSLMDMRLTQLKGILIEEDQE